MSSSDEELEGATAEELTAEAITALVELYESWHAAEPEEGHDAEAESWREELELIAGEGGDDGDAP